MKFKILSDAEVKKLFDQTSKQFKAEAYEFLVLSDIPKSREDFDKLSDSLGKIFEVCSKYGLDNEEMLNDDDDFSKRHVKEEVKEILKSEKSLSGLLKYQEELHGRADKYHDLIGKTIENGLCKKSKFNPEYPDALKEKDRIFIEIQDIYPVKEMVSSFCDEINEFASPYKKDIKMVEVKGNPRISINGQETKAIHCFNENLKALDKLDRRTLDFKDEQLFSVIEKGNYANFKAIIRSRKEALKQGGEFKNADLCRAFDKSEIFFYHFGKTFNENRVPNVMMSFEQTAKKMNSFYKDTIAKLEYESGMNSKNFVNPVNIVAVSRNPYDIATSAAYDAPEWTCFHPLGLRATGVNNHYVLEDDIAKGSLVYKGYHKDNMSKVIFRSIGSLYKNEQTGKKIYEHGLPIGERSLQVVEAIKAINENVLDDKNAVGNFKLQNTTYVAMFEESAPVIERKPKETSANIALKVKRDNFSR